MNYRLNIHKYISIGPSGPRLKVKHASIGRSGLLLHSRAGSLWFPTKKRAKKDSKRASKPYRHTYTGETVKMGRFLFQNM